MTLLLSPKFSFPYQLAPNNCLEHPMRSLRLSTPVATLAYICKYIFRNPRPRFFGSCKNFIRIQRNPNKLNFSTLDECHSPSKATILCRNRVEFNFHLISYILLPGSTSPRLREIILFNENVRKLLLEGFIMQITRFFLLPLHSAPFHSKRSKEKTFSVPLE